MHGDETPGGDKAPSPQNISMWLELLEAKQFRLSMFTQFCTSQYYVRGGGLLLQFDGVAWSVCRSVTGVRHAKQLNRLRCRSGCGLRWVQESIRLGSTPDPRATWQY